MHQLLSLTSCTIEEEVTSKSISSRHSNKLGIWTKLLKLWEAAIQRQSSKESIAKTYLSKCNSSSNNSSEVWLQGNNLALVPFKICHLVQKTNQTGAVLLLNQLLWAIYIMLYKHTPNRNILLSSLQLQQTMPQLPLVHSKIITNEQGHNNLADFHDNNLV